MLRPETLVDLAEAEAHHALHVLRLGEGERVELFNGRGVVAAGAITRARRRHCEVAIEDVIECPQPPAPRIHVASALPKATRQDWMLEKLTELGAASFTPLLCRRSSVKPTPGRDYLGRWSKICIAAARQCGLNYLPVLNEPVTPAELLTKSINTPGMTTLISHCGAGTVDLRAAVSKVPGEFTVMIGPEGGWSDEELAAADNAGVAIVKLGWTVLRVETAAAALAAALQVVAAPATG